MTKVYEIDKHNTLLNKVMPEFNFEDPPVDPIELAENMAESMKAHGGIGLAANQVGLPYRCIVIKSNPMIVMFNPKIVDYNEKKSLMDEGCLSFPNVVVKIKRSDTIRVRYTSPNGETGTSTFEGLTAHLLQHEIDHLNGITFLDRASVVQRNKAKTMMKKNVRNEKKKKTTIKKKKT